MAPAESQNIAAKSWAASALGAALRRWLAAYLTWRKEREAIAQLCSMSDRALSDIGLTRSGITAAVKGASAGSPRAGAVQAPVEG